MDSSSDSLSPVELLAEEFLDRQQRGENPTIDEYCEQHPELADEIKDVFEGFLLIEDLKPGSHDVSETFSGERRINGKKLDRVGDYRIIREVGRGGMGVVFEAEQESLRRRVALKVLPRQIAGDQKALQRFQQEARAAARMHHTNIVPVFEVGDDEEHVFYAMQLIQGQGLDVVVDDLRRLRNEHSGLPTTKSEAAALADRSHAQSIAASLVMGEFEQQNLIAEAQQEDAASPHDANGSEEYNATIIAETVLHGSGSTASAVLPGQSEISTAESDRGGYHLSVARIGHQTAGALAYAHARGIIHRDIKPSNLLLDTAGVVWVTDFGLAKTGDEALTHTGDILGTLRYMSPERFKGQCDVRADVYSLGLTLYEMLVLKPAFSSPDRLKLIELVSKSEPPTPRSVDPRIPRDLETIVLKSIDKDPRRRYQSADDLSDDLERFIQDEPIQARRISLVERLSRWSRRNKSLAVSLGTLATVILAVAVGSTIAAGYFRNMSRSLRESEERLTGVVTELEAKEEILNETITNLEREQYSRMQAEHDALQRADEALSARNEMALRSAYEAFTAPDGYLRGKELLDPLRPRLGEEDRRGLDFHIVNSLPDRSGGRILYNTGASFFRNAARFSPDDRFIAVSSQRGSVLILDAGSGEVVQRLVAPTGAASFRDIRWTADGTRIVAVGTRRGAPGSIHVWDVKSGLVQVSMPGAIAMALSPDETRLVTTQRGAGSLQVRDIRTGELMEPPFEIPPRFAYSVDWSAGNRIACCGPGGVHLIDLETGPLPLSEPPGAGESLPYWNAVRFSPDGRQLAAAVRQNLDSVVVWDMSRSTERPRTLPVSGDVQDLVWSHNGRLLAMPLSYGRTVELWDPATAERVRRFTGHSDTVGSCSWSHDDRQLVTTSHDGIVRVWDVVEAPPIPDFAGDQGRVGDLAWSPGSRYFATGQDEAVRIWDVRSPREAAFCFRGHDAWVSSVDWHPRANRLASSTHDEVLIWDWDTEDNARVVRTIDASNIEELAANTSFIGDVVWSPDGERIAVAVRSYSQNAVGMVLVYDADTQAEPRRFLLDGASSVSWEQGLLAAAGDDHFRIWNVETGEVVQPWPAPVESTWRVALSPQADRVAFSGSVTSRELGATTDQPILAILDFDTNHVLHLSGHEASATSISWTADGTRLLTASGDGRSILWNTTTGGQLLAFDAPDRVALTAARFSPDGLRIAIAGATPGIQVLDATPSYVEELAKELERGLTTRIEVDPEADDLVLRGRVLAKQGRWDEAVADFERARALSTERASSPAWFETTWWVAGPYAESLDEPQPPEQQTDPHRAIPSADESTEETTWIAAPFTTALDLGRLFDHQEHISAYAVTRICATEPREIGLLLGADDQVKVWCNDEAVYARVRDSPAIADDEAVEISLRRGWNTLLFKVTNNTAQHGLFARFSQDPRELAQAFARSEQWETALEWAGRALAEHPDDVPLLYVRGRAALRAGERQIAGESFDRVIETVADRELSHRSIAKLYLEHAQSLNSDEQRADATASLERARELYEQLVPSEGASERDAAGLADVLFMTMPRPTWTVVDPVEMKSALGEEGATLTRLEDGSILASGNNPGGDTGDRYQLIIDSPLKTVTAVRLEALTDDSLPNRGPGRRPNNGNFSMHWFWQQPERGQLSFNAVDADFHNPRFPINGRRWNIGGGQGESREAVYRLNTPVENEAGLRFSITMRFNSSPEYPSNNLGRFRISVTGDPNGFETAAHRLDIQKITNGWERLAATYHVTGDEAALDALLERKPDAAAGIVALAMDEADWLEDGEANPTSVTEAITSALRIQPDSAELAERLSEICLNAHPQRAGEAGLQTLIDHQRSIGAPEQQLADTLRRRGALYVRAGEWRSAAADYGEAVKLDTTAGHVEWARAAAVYAFTGEADEYHDFCRTMLARFKALDREEDDDESTRAATAERVPSKAATAEHVTRSMLLLGPELESDLQPEDYPVSVVLDALEGDDLHTHAQAWFRATRALWVCRFPAFGDPDEALQWVDQSGNEPRTLSLMQLTVHALLHARHGDPGEARSLLDQARAIMENTHDMKWLDDGSLDGSTILNGTFVDNSLLIPEILRLEVERVLRDGADNQAVDAAPAEGGESQP